MRLGRADDICTVKCRLVYMKNLSLDPKIKEQKHAHHKNRIEKYNYERQTCYVPVPPALLTVVYLVLPKT